MRSHVGSTGTEQACDPFLHTAGINAQIFGNEGRRFRASDRTFTRFDLSPDDLLGKQSATGKATRSTIRTGEQLGDIVDARILKDPQLAMRHSKNDGQENAKTGQECYGSRDTHAG
jgi:hypothetical protein